MSLYNQICGENPEADAILGLLGLSRDSIPRYRDCHIVGLAPDKAGIIVLTRTGGDNRDCHDNSVLERHPDFVNSDDDSFDRTFAHWLFEVQVSQFPTAMKILERQGDYRTLERFQQIVEDLRAGKDTPETRHALDVGRKIFEDLERGSKHAGKKGGVVIVRV